MFLDKLRFHFTVPKILRDAAAVGLSAVVVEVLHITNPQVVNVIHEVLHNLLGG